jgi:hypothetical protein
MYGSFSVGCQFERFPDSNLTANRFCNSVLISHRTLDRTVSLSRLKHKCLAAYGSPEGIYKHILQPPITLGHGTDYQKLTSRRGGEVQSALQPALLLRATGILFV